MNEIDQRKSIFSSESLPRVTPIVRLLLPDAQPLITFLQRLDRAHHKIYNIVQKHSQCLKIGYRLYSMSNGETLHFNFCYGIYSILPDGKILFAHGSVQDKRVNDCIHLLQNCIVGSALVRNLDIAFPQVTRKLLVFRVYNNEFAYLN